MQVHCPYLECNKPVMWMNYDYHMKICEYRELECLYKKSGCTKKILLMDFNEHLKKCPYRKPCDECNQVT